MATFFGGFSSAAAADPDTNTNATPVSIVETNNQEILRAYLQLQEQLHLTQLAIEQNRQEARETVAQTSDLLVGKLQTIEKALEAQRTREIEAMQSSNRVMLLVAGTFASVGFVAMLLMSFFQWRTVSRLALISGAPSARLKLGAGARSGLELDEAQVLTGGPAEQFQLAITRRGRET